MNCGAAAAKKAIMTMVDDMRDLASSWSAWIMPTAMAQKMTVRANPEASSRKDDDEHKPGEEESRHKAVEGAARQLETSQGQPLGQPRLFHAFTNDDRSEAQPREHGGPRPEYDFGIRHAAKDIGEREHGRHADGGEYIERPCYDGGAGKPHVQREMRRDVLRGKEVDAARDKQGHSPFESLNGIHNDLCWYEGKMA